MIEEFSISTSRKEDFIDITVHIEKIVRRSRKSEGLCVVYIPHTTAAITINENADPSVRKDIVESLDRIVPESELYSHLEGNAPAHVKATLLGNSLTLLIKDNNIVLGTWQGIYFCEFDGPRKRKVIVRIF